MARVQSPTPAKIKLARKKASHTQKEAADVVHTDDRGWRAWEKGEYAMPPAAWELYLLRTQATIFTEPQDLEIHDV